MGDYVASISYGKDSLAMLEVIAQNNLPLDRIIHSEIQAVDGIPSELPDMLNFKIRADKIIKDRYGIQVEHVRASKTFEQLFYTPVRHRDPTYTGQCRGWPLTKGAWCARDQKIAVLQPLQRHAEMVYLGIGPEEPRRHNVLTGKIRSPLVDYNISVGDRYEICRNLGLLSPVYTSSARSGCWYCPKQPLEQLRRIRKIYPEYWRIMLKWDCDSPVEYKPGHTLREYDRRFQAEDKGVVPLDRRFRWKMLEGEINEQHNANNPNDM